MNAITQYNNIMRDICREYNTIGTSFSEGTEGWTIRDMVSEMQYTLDIYNDEGCIYLEEAHDETQPADKPWYKEWINQKRRMERFIEKYKGEAAKAECTMRHCSIYD